jgi:hypothetical protein
VTIFANVAFPTAGNYVVQTLINSNVFAEQTLAVSDMNQQPPLINTETIQ